MHGLTRIEHHGLQLVLDLSGDMPARLLHLDMRPFDPGRIPDANAWAYRLVEVDAAGEDSDYIAAGRLAGSALGGRLRPVALRDEMLPAGRRIAVEQRDPSTGLGVTSHLLLASGLPVVESWTEVTGGDRPVTLTAVSSAFLCGLVKDGEGPRHTRAEIRLPHNSWYAEMQWQRASLPDLGLANTFSFGSRHIGLRSVGTWCSANHLPMGWLGRAQGGGLLWEILHDGSWSWQIGESVHDLYLHVAGPTEPAGSWWRTLAPGERYQTPRAVLAPAAPDGGFDEAVASLTRWRRATRTAELGGMPVVFNDYMNCLMGDPTEAKVLPLIDAAARLGAEVYCMDSGWYAKPGERWSLNMGRWAVNRERFPNGLRPVMDRVRELGMIPGIWFEIEVMTANCPDFQDLPDECFLLHHGRRWVSHRRHLLDFRHPRVKALADQAIDMAVEEFGCGFLKLDYNVGSNAGPDSDGRAESPGVGLMQHQEAFLAWVDGVRTRHPGLLLEHCASGGMRISQPFLSRMGVTSNSDQGDPVHVARIACASPAIIPPEQDGTWALPKRTDGPEAVAFAMLCALPLRMSLAGDAAELTGMQAALVEEAVGLHKRLRGELSGAVPCWPLGLPGWDDPWLCLGLRTADRLYLAVWRRDGGPEEIALTLPAGHGAVEILYPAELPTAWRVEGGALALRLAERTARLIAVDLR